MPERMVSHAAVGQVMSQHEVVVIVVVEGVHVVHVGHIVRVGHVVGKLVVVVVVVVVVFETDGLLQSQHPEVM